MSPYAGELVALAALFGNPRRALVERFFNGAATVSDGGRVNVLLDRDATAAEAHLLDRLAVLRAGTVEVREATDWLRRAADWFDIRRSQPRGPQRAFNIWRGEPLAEALKRLEDHRAADDADSVTLSSTLRRRLR